MYLVGQSVEAKGLNLNILYIVWSRMTKDMKTPHPSEHLPFPLIIMRILRAHKIDTQFTNYRHSLGMINESTVIKSLPRLVEDALPAQTTPHAFGSSRSPIDTSEDDASITSIYRE